MNTRKWAVPAVVLQVVDGDTVRLELDLGWRIRYTARCRVASIDAPEISTPEGLAAKSYAESLLKPGDLVTFISHELDKYGRPLGTITYGGLAMRDFGTDMEGKGHARSVNW